MKENTLFKLDLLQTYYLQKPARFGVTKQMMRSEKYQSKKSNQSSTTTTNSKRIEKQKHKLLQLTRNEAFEMIKKLQCEVFEKKIHFFEIALNRAMIKILKKERQKLIQLQVSEKAVDEKLKKSDLNEKIKVIDSIINKDNSIALQNNIKHKIFKILIKTFPDKLDLKNNRFEGIPENYIDYIKNMKENNPYKENGDILNNLLSKIYADKSIKEIIENISSLELVWGPKKYSKNNDDELKEFEEEEDEEEEDNKIENQVRINDVDSDNEEIEQEKGEFDEDYEKLYEGYKDYIVASSDEEEEDEDDENEKAGNNNDNTGFILDPSINYNEITDEEPSEDDEFEINENLQEEGEDIKTKESKRSLEDDDFFAQEPNNKKSKRATMKDIQLPALAVGYYSGGESDEETNDSLVDEITTTRKNRRGQRARQKIWEKKYGKGAKHVVKEQQRDKSERERLRLEYEARKIKREEKQRDREQREQEREEKKKKQQEKTLHPSWEAKIKAQESLKKAKFQGKKITFD